jgi:hypothetical protein
LKTISDILPVVGRDRPVQVETDNHDLQGAINPVVKKIVDQLFNQLSSVFPAWQHNWKTDKDLNDAKKEWVKALSESSVNTIDQIKTGMTKARKSDSDFLPSPGKFIGWCKRTPDDAGWPTISAAMKSCIRHHENQRRFQKARIYIRPMIVELCTRVDWFLMSTERDSKKTEAHFKETYQNMFDSGYVEPVKTSSLELPTNIQVMKNMSTEQRDTEQKRSLTALEKLRGSINV